MDIQAWYERNTRQVGQSGQCTAVIRLLCAHQSWHVWHLDRERDAEDWASEAGAIIAELAEQWSARKWQVTLVAEDKSGQILCQCPFEVMGRNKAAQTAAGGADQVKVWAEAMDNLQRTWERTLSVVNEQLLLQQKQMAEQGQRYIQMMGYVNEAEQYRATEPQRIAEAIGKTAADPLKEKLTEVLPDILELASKLVERQATKQPPVAPLKAVPTT